MKKQFLLLIIIMLAGICFSSLTDNGLKACCKNNPAACSGTTKSTGQKIQVYYEESEDASLNIFMNPFKQL